MPNPLTDPIQPPCLWMTSDFGCIGRFWWCNTQQRPRDWILGDWPFPLWGSVHWFAPTPSQSPLSPDATHEHPTGA